MLKKGIWSQDVIRVRFCTSASETFAWPSVIKAMDKVIITVVGKDTIGIIAKVCNYLSDNRINILDISQTIVAGYFNMMLIADLTACDKEFGVVADELRAVGEEIGVRILAQKEEIFTKMHRI